MKEWGGWRSGEAVEDRGVGRLGRMEEWRGWGGWRSGEDRGVRIVLAILLEE